MMSSESRSPLGSVDGSMSAVSDCRHISSPVRSELPSPSSSHRTQSPDVNISGLPAGPSASACTLAPRSPTDSETPSPTGHSQSSASLCTLRSANPTFSVSPRTTSGNGYPMGAVTSKMKVLLHIREGANVEEYTYAVGTAEERRSFVVSCLRHAEHMDEQGIVKELIPGMMSMLAFSDCCLTIASVLPDFMRHASMERKDVFVYFMGLIMSLSSSSDLAVVQRVSVSLRKIIQCAGDDVFEELLFPFVVSMIMSQWSSPRAVAASLMAVVAARRHASRATGWTVKQCFSRFTELTQDSCTFVRQVCAECMHDWVMVAKLRRMNIVQMPLSVVRKCIINDESDAVRYTYVAELVPLADKVGKEATSRHLLSLYIKASKDASWRVRYYAAKNLFAFTQLCAEPSSLLDVFVRLCEDEVKEVRVVIVDQLEAFSPDKGEVEVFTKACAAASLLARDEEPAVRASVAKNLYLLLSPIVMQTYLPEQRETLLGLFTDDNYSVAEGATRNVSRVLETLIAYIRADTAGDAANCAKPSYTLVPQDEHNVHPVVDASCAQGGHAGCTTAGKHTGGCCCGPPEVTTAKDVSEEEPFTGSTKENVGGGEEMLQSSAAYVCAALADRLGYVSESRNWRLREACAHVTRYFCLAFTQQEFVPLLGIVRKLLCDPISAVRARCVDTLAIVASAYGPKMAALVMGELLKKEFEVIEEIPFIMRMMAIRCFSSLAPLIDGLPPDDVQRCELHRRWMMMLIPLAADDVPNVRLLLAKTIATQWEWYRTCSNQDVVRQCVDRLRRDSEVDVIAAMEAVGAMLKETLLQHANGPHDLLSLSQHDSVQRLISVQRVGRILSQRALCKFMSYLISPRRSPEGEEEEGRCEDDVGVVGTSRVVEDDSNPPPQPHPSPGCSGPTYHFISKPLFAVPCDSVTAGDTGGSGCCDTLITILVDSKHVLVITDCHKKSTDTRSVFYVVQLHAQGQDIYGRSLLPIAKPSGCVQDESRFNVLQPLQEEAAEFVDPSFDNVEGQHSTERSSRLISPLDDSMSNGSLSYDDETTQCAVAGGSNAPMHANLPHRQLTNVCLVADAVSHAIWAVDVDLKSLKVEVVLPCCYWGGSGGHEETQAITHERHEQGLDFTSKKAAILGGDRGFVDGTFEAARFNTPCALCWNTSTYDAGKGTHDDKKRVMGSSILFVSDWGNSALRQVDFVSRMVRTIVGIDGVPGYRDGAYAASQLQRAAVLLWSSAGLLFVDEPNNAVRLLARVSKMEDANDTSEIKEPPPLASVMENDESINAFRGSRRVPESGEVVAPVTSSHMQIFTVAGGLRSGSKIEDDVSDVIRSNLGTSSAAALAPDGSGVLFVDGHSGSLRLLSSHGVKTLVDSKLSTDTLSVSSCLVGCTHILACTLSLHPGDRPRSAFLVSSTTRHAVSLLILCDGSMENDVLSAGADLPAEALLTPARLPRLRKGTLRKYKRTAKKSVHMCDSKANGTIRSPRNDADEALCGTNKLLDYSAHCSKENDSRPSVNEKRGSPLCNPVLLQESSSVRPDLTVRLEEAAAGVFDIYLRYARRFVPQHMRLVACPTSCKHHPHDPMYTCSLSLIGFWRLITHAGYFATCPALVSSLFPFPRVDKPPALRLKEGKCNDLLYLNLYDWRVVLELIYGWSVRRHGHHIVSLMCPDYFFRVIVLLYRCKESWKERQDGGEQDAGGDGVGVGVLRCDWHAASTSLESVSDEEVFAAYDDFTRRIREVRLLLRRSEGLPADGHVSTGSHQQPDTIDRGGEVKLLGDDVLQLLMLNECALRQLFESYSRSTTLTTRSTTWCDSSRRGVTVMLRLKQILSGGREHSFASTDRVNGMPYTEFRRLFFMIGVFPTLITEPLLQRAFVDALQTPLFCRIRMDPVDDTTKHEEKQALSTNDSTAKGPTEMTLLRQDAAERRKSSSHNDKRSVRQNAELSFLVFVEAFTRVALTVFSQCPEHDTREYPTAAAKVHALMCWINRSIELNLTREGDIMHHLGPYINNTTSHQYIVQYSQRPFPFFNISTTKSFSNSHENNDQHDKSSRNENNESTKSMGVSI